MILYIYCVRAFCYVYPQFRNVKLVSKGSDRLVTLVKIHNLRGLESYLRY